MKTDNHPRKLNQNNLQAFAGQVTIPTYQRNQLQRSMVHLGVGGFHRAHLAAYLDDLAEQGITQEWGESGVGILPVDKPMAEALLPQDCLYTLVERSAAGDKARIIGSMLGYQFAPDNPAAVLSMLTDPATKIVSLTITEGGYNVDSQTGLFNTANPAVQADLVNQSSPKTVFGYICAALEQRRKAGEKPFTVLSCDNLQGNGKIAKTAILSFARLQSETLAAWIEANVAFPNGMVDRITPQTTEADRLYVAQAFGIEDAWPVMTEPFRQWVLEDNFCNGRPPFEEVGVQLVSDVHPYETMKLRLLNASHQAMGYLGYLSGYRYIHEVMGDADFRRFIKRMMDEEVTPLLPPVPGIDLNDYKETLLLRFANPKIADQVMRICTDGSDRMPKFLLPSLSEALQQNKPHRLLTLAVAGWFRFLRGVDEQGQNIPIADPLADQLKARANEARENPRALLSLREIFGDLGQHDAFVAELAQALAELDTGGAKRTLQAYLATPPA
ncbi:MAG TPA: mannitol dehydrogenase family protein [Chloroflexia bacterium]|nr:mannitol dehydrogenase family protein [Chloroflexia bacterium]